MEVLDFQKEFLEEVKATAAAEGAGSNAAFVEVASSYLITAEALPDFETSFYLGVGKNNRKIRVDGYFLDDFDLTFYLVIADYTGLDSREVISKSGASSILDRLYYFLEEVHDKKLYREVEPSTPVSDLIELLRINKDRIRKYKLILLTDGFMSSRISEIEQKNYNGVPVESQIWDIDRIFRVCSSDLGRQEIEIDFKSYDNSKGIPFLEASITDSDDYKSFLCIMPGSVLADVYDYYGGQLLEGNVRSFLSTKVAVNKKIRETILKSPWNFFAYNNGISATAVELKFENTEEGRYITYAKDFQIINGGQTTASLANARFKDKADLSKIYVQMKLTEVDSDVYKAGELIRNISRSSNSQNKVSDADFFSSHPFHVRMEQISRRIFAPATGGAQYETRWFYERARGQYFQSQMRLTKSQRDKFAIQNPKKQLLTKTDLAKVRNSWAGLPHLVSKGAQTNFMKYAELVDDTWTKSNTPFNEKYFKDSVALAILFKHTEWIVSHQPWYEQGYRANIVTYSLALLQKIITSQSPKSELDLQIIWNKQEVPDLITNELIPITKLVFDSITVADRGTINVTQWCKREECWTRIKLISHQLANSFEKVLISKDDVRIVTRDAQKNQKFTSDLDAQVKVLDLGSLFWINLNEFVMEKRLNISSHQLKAIQLAVRIPTKLPSSSQSIQLLSLLEYAEANGFNFNN